jgi:7,8-dihydropterin-6-yl-methyl-4-(beta-D-ribofuranosyl)aminobenzene 5'-phosphate synthase
MSSAYWCKHGELVRDPINDDQAIVISVEGKALVVVAGRARSGIVNTVLYAQEISGVEEVWAIIGGFHLGTATPERIERTIGELKAIGPRLVMPEHCTGFGATHLFATEMPDEFAFNAVGTRLVS